jgi:hypothetical protein
MRVHEDTNEIKLVKNALKRFGSDFDDKLPGD